MDDFFERVAALRREHRAFAIATVVAGVRRCPRTWVTTQSCSLTAGWKGSSAAPARAIVRQQALAALRGAARTAGVDSAGASEAGESTPSMSS